MSRRGRHVAAALTVAGALAVTVGSGFLRLLPSAEPPRFGELQTDALQSPVRVSRDPYGVPHVRADTLQEAYVGLGFAHAQDRLWQMELLRRTASGRLSELFGRTTLEQDRLARVLGFARAAREEAKALSSTTRDVLSAYVAGINLYIEQIRSGEARAPLELRWLVLEPEPWTPADSLALLRLRAWLLNRSLHASLLLERLVREIGGVAAQDFFPVRPLDTAPELIGSLLRLGDTIETTARAIGLQAHAGSLGFVVGPGRALREGALLANDPHVSFRLPALFYVAHLSAPGWELSGGTWPGAPIFWTGRNRWIAWGQVVLHASVSDLFEETLDPGDPRRYALRGGWREVDRVVESIAVRGEPDETLEILESRNGPLLGAVHPDDARLRSLALRWTGQDRRSGMDALLRLQHAQDWQGFRHALRRLSAPPATFLYADRAGRIGLQLAGHLPLRAIETGLLPVPGRSRYYDWRGFVPFKELPHQFGSQLPFLVASTRPEMPGLPHPVTWLWHPGRAEARLRELLESSGPLDLERVLAIQRDVSSGQGRDRVRRLLDGVEPRHAPAARVRELLLAWDGGTDPDAVGAAVYHVFRDSLARLLLAERVGEELEAEFVRLAEPFPGVLLDRFVERAAEEMGGGELAERALEETWKTLEVRVSSNPRKWTWGRVHRLRLRHDFEALGEGPVAWLGRRLGRGPFPAPGDADSIWTMYHRELPGSGILVGPAFRYAVALDDPAHARFGLAGGQSGHPGSVHYDDALADWLRGRARPLWTHRADVADHEQSVWELRPRHGP